MSDTADTPGHAGPWPVLDPEERRVLGVLVEKAKTTPDAYPLSLNALVTGCNQKSNRDPILDLDEDDVLEALGRCRTRGLVCKVTGGRVERWRHLLYEQWHVGKVDLAILAELLLRGPQTEGELRGRASRMEAIDDLDALRDNLRPLLDRNLVVYLTPEDRRGAILSHGFHSKNELDRLVRHHASHPAVVAPSPVATATATAVARSEPAVSRADGAVEALQRELTALRQQLDAGQARLAAVEQLVAGLREQLRATMEEVRGLRQALGG